MSLRQDDLASLARDLEERALLPDGDLERATLYAVMGVSFASGHVLALRRLGNTSLAGAYSSVWHRDPDGRWTIYVDRPREQTCPRYFGSAVAASVVTPIVTRWSGPRRLEVEVPAAGLVWSMEMATTRATRFLSFVGAILPERLWRSPLMLRILGALAGPLLGAGRLGLTGRVPNGQRFLALPRRCWLVRASSARLRDHDLGAMAPLPVQAQLGDFRIPQRGLFAMGDTFFETFDPTRHRLVFESEPSQAG